MFSLIVSAIAIVLVATLVLATIYYGTNTYSKAGAEAVATRLANETNQIQSASVLFFTDHQRYPTTLEELAENGQYLSQVPAGWTNARGDFMNEDQKLDEDACLTYNRRIDIPFVPSCDDPFYSQSVVCCQKTADQ